MLNPKKYKKYLEQVGQPANQVQLISSHLVGGLAHINFLYMADIRLRNINKAQLIKLEQIKAFLKIKLDHRSKGTKIMTKVLESMINRFMDDQRTIQDQRKTITGLQAILERYQTNEAGIKKLIQETIWKGERLAKEGKDLQKRVGKHITQKR